LFLNQIFGLVLNLQTLKFYSTPTQVIAKKGTPTQVIAKKGILDE